jgi:hypothetical protein
MVNDLQELWVVSLLSLSGLPLHGKEQLGLLSKGPGARNP